MNTMSPFDSVLEFVCWWLFTWGLLIASLAVLSQQGQSLLIAGVKVGQSRFKWIVGAVAIWSIIIIIVGLEAIVQETMLFVQFLIGFKSFLFKETICFFIILLILGCIRNLVASGIPFKVLVQKIMILTVILVAMHCSLLHGLTGLLNPYTHDGGFLAYCILHKTAPVEFLEGELYSAIRWRQRAEEIREPYESILSGTPAEFDRGLFSLACLLSLRMTSSQIERLKSNLGTDIELFPVYYDYGTEYFEKNKVRICFSKFDNRCNSCGCIILERSQEADYYGSVSLSLFDALDGKCFQPNSEPNHKDKSNESIQQWNNGSSAKTESAVNPTQLSERFLKCRDTILAESSLFGDDALADFEKNAAANELFSLSELPDGVVGDLARMFRSPNEDEVWRDYCLQFLGSALERENGVTDEDRALARETLVGTLASTNAIFAGTALRSLHRGDPSDPLVASNALRIARDPSYPSSSRITALLILEDCVRSTSSTPSTLSTLAETASAISADPSASALLRRTAEAVLERNAD